MLRFIGVAPQVPWSTFGRVVGVAWLWAAAYVAVGFALSLPTPLPIEPAILDRLAAWHTPGRIGLVRGISGIGNVWIVGAAAGVLAVGLHLHGARLAGDVRLLLIATYGGALVITAPLKLLTARARPSGALVGSLSSAYPSGHAMRTAAVITVLVWFVARWRARAIQRLGAAAVLVVVGVAVATARVFLWAHWPSDVAVGLLLGATWAIAMVHLSRPLRAPTDQLATT